MMVFGVDLVGPNLVMVAALDTHIDGICGQQVLAFRLISKELLEQGQAFPVPILKGSMIRSVDTFQRDDALIPIPF